MIMSCIRNDRLTVLPAFRFRNGASRDGSSRSETRRREGKDMGQEPRSTVIHRSLIAEHQPFSSAMPFSASSFFACSFLARCVRPIPRSTLGALVN